MEKNILTMENLLNYKNYRYASEDNTYLTKIYSKFWRKIQIFIPSNIHPNLLTVMGLCSVILGYILRNYPNGNLYMGLGVFLYMNLDGLDGIHARTIKQTSIIGEYFDHLIDLSNMGMIAIGLMEQFGIKNHLTKNILMCGLSFIFMLPHYEAIYTSKMIFKGISDVSLFLTCTIVIFLFNLKIPYFFYRDELFLCMGICLSIYSIYWLYQINLNNYRLKQKIEIKLPILMLFYYLVKNICGIARLKNNLTLWSASDMLLLLNIINYKIFGFKANKSLILVPVVYAFNPIIATVYVVYYIIDFVIKLSTQLDINLFKVKKKIPRVYCCGVFDLCHIGHMLLFEKIVKLFDEPIELIVGVHSDESCSGYKRSPILNEEIRYNTVAHCKHVNSVFIDAPLITTKEFIIKNKIDWVIIGEEYRDKKDKYWYPGAFELSNYIYISRCDEISTSEIIKKIKNNY